MTGSSFAEKAQAIQDIIDRRITRIDRELHALRQTITVLDRVLLQNYEDT